MPRAEKQYRHQVECDIRKESEPRKLRRGTLAQVEEGTA